jgi:hypothetical protein
MRASPVIRLAALALLTLPALGLANTPDPPAPVSEVQPVQEYSIPFGPVAVGDRMKQPEPLTHLGTDFGRMGPGGPRIEWRDGEAVIDTHNSGWAGLWHSLAGLGREKDRTLDFLRCYPPQIVDRFQPRATGVIVRLGGQGRFRLEVKSADGQALWSWEHDFASPTPMREFVLDCPPEKLRAAKFLNWVAEPGSRFAVDRLALRVEFPPVPFPEKVFLISYAKLAHCYDPVGGLVKDRAHRPEGTHGSVPASGMYALATSVAWTKGIVERPFAERTLHEIHRVVSSLPRADGWLPHYVNREADGRYEMIPGTEYSTVDTSLYYHGMILAAQVLGDRGMLAELDREVHGLRFDKLWTTDGWVNHGFLQDGHTPLRGVWNGWGGETALVLLLERMALGDHAPLKMAPLGSVHNGVGFIGEIQSLFYPQFDQDRPDAVTEIDWRKSRLRLLRAQEDYYPVHEPASPAAKAGLFGLSAGVGYRGLNYAANGTDKVRDDLIHPHYMLMAGRWQPERTFELLRRMESEGLLPPWGLVENVKPDLSEYLPMLGSLNAAFETLGAYHLWARDEHQADVIDQAAQTCPLTAEAIRGFYP